LRRRPSVLDGRVSAEWSRCPGSMARRARDSVAPLRRSSACWMPARIGRLSDGVGRRQPVTIRKASLMTGSMRRVWALRHQTGTQYSAIKCTRAKVAIRSVVTQATQLDPASRFRSATRDVSLLLLPKWLKVLAISERPVQRYSEAFGPEAERQGFVIDFFVKMKTADAVFVVLSFSFQVWRYSLTVAMSLPNTSSTYTACQSPSACMIASSYGDGGWKAIKSI